MSINIKMPASFFESQFIPEPIQDWQDYIEGVKRSLQGTFLDSRGQIEVEIALRNAISRLCNERGIVFNPRDLTLGQNAPR